MKILIVDDNEDSRIILSKNFEHIGYSTREATNGLDALELARDIKPDLIVSDILMPKMDGFALCREIKENKELRDIPFIFYTANYIDPKDEQLAKKLGAYRYIVKPLETTKFLKIVNEALMEYREKKQAVAAATKPPQKDDRHSIRKMYEESLLRMLQKKVQELQLYKKIFTNSKDAIIIISPDGYFIKQNACHKKLLGYSDEELVENKPSVYMGEKPFEHILNELRTTKKYRGELICRTKSSQTLNIDMSTFPIYDENGTITNYVGIERDITKRKINEHKLRITVYELKELKKRLQAENIYLQDEIKVEHNFEEIIGISTTLKKVLRKTEQVATTNSTVLILGESGTGKELLARAIHNISSRRNRPLLKVNCAALHSSLIESELFGHEKGAFTGAHTRRIGRFELANEGTIFLDEIGDLPLMLQAKLLRVLQEGEFERLGSTNTIKVDVRVIAATNRDLANAIKEGNFREDLFYRLNVFPIEIPPLREHKEDIPKLVNHFIQKYSAKIGKKIDIIPRKAMDEIMSYQWPGNVRELENVIERSVILSNGTSLHLSEKLYASTKFLNESEKIPTLKETEIALILKALNAKDWVVGGKNGAAALLDIPTTTLRERIIKYNLKRNK